MIQIAIGAGVALFALLVLLWMTLTTIGDDQVGIVTKKFATKDLPTGRLVALDGEAGIQADTLPPGWHFFLWPWQYSIEKVDMVVVPESEIALVIANDGKTKPDHRILCDRVGCDNFQNGRQFLADGGYRGRQISKLTTGTYRINTRLFTIVTKKNAQEFGIKPDYLDIFVVPTSRIGIVTVQDGKNLDAGEIAAPTVEGHSTFQDEQAFIDRGGYRGLQQEVLRAGSWSLNPWFASVEVVDTVNIPIAHVGVVISYVGPAGADVSGSDFKYGDLVENGKRGVWHKTLNPGVYPMNPKTMKVEKVPTSNIVLNWSSRTEGHGLDGRLSSIKVQSKDGFTIEMSIQQIIHVPYEVAPRLIARFGTMQDLVQNVLEPLIGNYFRNTVQSVDMLDFIQNRKTYQAMSKQYVTEALKEYDVGGVDTLIGEITPPAALMQTLQDRKLAEEGKLTISMQMELENTRNDKERATALANSQESRVKAEVAVQIASQEAEASVTKAKGAAQVLVTESEAKASVMKNIADAEGEALKLRSTNEAESIKLLAAANADKIFKPGKAEADVIKLKTEAMGQGAYAATMIAESISKSTQRLVPEVMMGGNGASANPAEALLGLLATQMAQSRGSSEVTATLK